MKDGKLISKEAKEIHRGAKVCKTKTRISLSEMNKDERSLLLYIESVSVDYGGLVNRLRINDDDREILRRWDKEGFISYCRLSSENVVMPIDKNDSSIVFLSDEAWELAHEERRARSLRKRNSPPICNIITTKKVTE